MLKGIPHLFLSNKTFRASNISLLVPDTSLYYLALHMKLATAARSSQLVEIFAYENAVAASNKQPFSRSSNATLVYQFHNLFSQERLFVFAPSLKALPVSVPKSLAELFVSAAWLEREVGEMYGIAFEGKKDLRNLMLQYGDSSAPFRKSYPSIGTKEVTYDPVTDNLLQTPVSTQI